MKLLPPFTQKQFDNVPEGAKPQIEGDVSLLFDKSITSLPENLKVGGNLYLRGTAITSLPENLKVGGNLDLEGTAITSLPENLKVGGNLYLRGTAITSLPENLKVGGNLDLRGTAITSLPENLKVGGNLDLRGTAITSLPENLKVGGNLYLRGTAITSLPENLKEISIIEIDTKGKWGVSVSKSLIKIGCETNGKTYWKDFFKKGKFIDTDPANYPEDYELIKQDFENALIIQKKMF